MLLSEVQRTESGGVISMVRTLAIKKGQTREKTVGFQEMGTFAATVVERSFSLFSLRRAKNNLGVS
jgi:hypothetical protein